MLCYRYSRSIYSTLFITGIPKADGFDPSGKVPGEYPEPESDYCRREARPGARGVVNTKELMAKLLSAKLINIINSLKVEDLPPVVEQGLGKMEN